MRIGVHSYNSPKVWSNRLLTKRKVLFKIRDKKMSKGLNFYSCATMFHLFMRCFKSIRNCMGVSPSMTMTHQIASWEDEWGRTADQWWKQHHNGQRKYPNKTASLIQKSVIKHICSDYAQGYLKDSSVLLTSHITESQ